MSMKVDEALANACVETEPSVSPQPVTNTYYLQESKPEHADYRDYLRQRLGQLRGENRHYNIARVAQKPGVDPSLISRVLCKRRHLDFSRVENVIEVFKIPAQERELFFLLFLRAKLVAGASPVLDGLVAKVKG